MTFRLENISTSVGGFNTGKTTDVRLIVLRSAFPYTLLLAGATNFLLFFASMFAALNLSKKWQQNGSAGRYTSPLSAIPNWVYGIILTMIFAGVLHLLSLSRL
jgi:ABC-type dipeptide/oligopeptide/nickel transport system permease component